MLMILSPAKTFTSGENVPHTNFKALLFHEKTAKLVEQLSSFSNEQLGSLMKMSEELATLNSARYRQFYSDELQALPSIYAFSGEAYKGLDALTLEQGALEFSNESLRILSGLYGVLHPFDAINPYRLEMGLKFSGEHGKNLYGYWKKEVTDYFLSALATTPGDQVLINLASTEYSKVVDFKQIKQQYGVLTIEFKEQKGESFRTVGMYAKRARGQMARYILTRKLHSVEELKQFNEEGYQFNEDLSTPTTWVFTCSVKG